MTAYQRAADDIEAKIRQGHFAAGEKIYSRREICQLYGISDMTAYKAQQLLISRNLLQMMPGKGFVVKAIQPLEQAVERPVINSICFYATSNTLGQYPSGAPGYGQRALAGMKKRAAELGVPLRVEMLNASSTKLVATPAGKRPGEAVIALGTIPVRTCMISRLCDPSAQIVLIDNCVSECHAVLTDNWAGISALLDHLQSRNCKKIVYAARMYTFHTDINVNERLHCFELETRRRGIEGVVFQSDDYAELARLVYETERPDAVMFSQDTPALHFKAMPRKPGQKLPVITGFDDISADGDGLESLTTYRTDCEAIGAAAVDTLLLHVHARNAIHIRVPGKLTVRD